jgi:hypothetical protein
MPKAGKYDLTIEQGSELKRKFVLLDADGQPEDLTNDFIRLYVRQSKWATNAVGKYDICEGNIPQIYLGANSGEFYFYLAADETHYHDWYTVGFFDIELTPFTANNHAISDSTAVGKLGEITYTGMTSSNITVTWCGKDTGGGQHITNNIANAADADCNLYVKVDGASTFEWGIAGDGGGALATGVAFNAGNPVYLDDGATDTGVYIVFAVAYGAGTIGHKVELYTFGTNTWNTDVVNAGSVGEVEPATANGQAALPFRDMTGFSAVIYTPGNWTEDSESPQGYTGPAGWDDYYDVPTIELAGNTRMVCIDDWQKWLWFQIQIETAVDNTVPGGTAQTFRWRATAGGSGTYLNFLADDQDPLRRDTLAWNETGVTIDISQTAGVEYDANVAHGYSNQDGFMHIHNGMYIRFVDSAAPGVAIKNGIRQHSMFNWSNQFPIISLVGFASSGTDDLYRLRRHISDGQGIEFTRILQTSDLIDESAEPANVKRVAFSESNTKRILQGKVKIDRQVTHDVLLPYDPYPTFL